MSAHVLLLQVSASWVPSSSVPSRRTSRRRSSSAVYCRIWSDLEVGIGVSRSQSLLLAVQCLNGLAICSPSHLLTHPFVHPFIHDLPLSQALPCLRQSCCCCTWTAPRAGWRCGPAPMWRVELLPPPASSRASSSLRRASVTSCASPAGLRFRVWDWIFRRGLLSRKPSDPEPIFEPEPFFLNRNPFFLTESPLMPLL